jgi:hypothetical protein
VEAVGLGKWLHHTTGYADDEEDHYDRNDETGGGAPARISVTVV